MLLSFNRLPMKHVLSLVSVVTEAAAFTFAQATDPVCIVGAGPAGLTVANKLQAKGYETVIFEKDPEVGGKCKAPYDKL
jgi:heterodisulfide reductase subunit A-like polyferredoxin